MAPRFKLEDGKALFITYRKDFLKACNYRDTLFRQYQNCFKFTILYTAKRFNHYCDSNQAGSQAPDVLLSREDEDFFMDFMGNAKLQYITYNRNRTKFYFYPSDATLIKYETADSELAGYNLGYGFYLTEHRAE